MRTCRSRRLESSRHRRPKNSCRASDMRGAHPFSLTRRLFLLSGHRKVAHCRGRVPPSTAIGSSSPHIVHVTTIKWNTKSATLTAAFASATVRIHVKCPTVELAESTFTFAAHALTCDGEEALASFVAQLRSATGRLSIVGHACQIGSKQENIKLSFRRATTVFEALTALVEKERLPGVTIDRPVGVGDSEPKKGVNCDHLKGDRRMFEQYKACLSPNRRVVVELHPARQAGKDQFVD
jgi:outer membrane protein OmpA-like peptidoglycan-associated protein